MARVQYLHQILNPNFRNSNMTGSRTQSSTNVEQGTNAQIHYSHQENHHGVGVGDNGEAHNNMDGFEDYESTETCCSCRYAWTRPLRLILPRGFQCDDITADSDYNPSSTIICIIFFESRTETDIQNTRFLAGEFGCVSRTLSARAINHADVAITYYGAYQPTLL